MDAHCAIKSWTGSDKICKYLPGKLYESMNKTSLLHVAPTAEFKHENTMTNFFKMYIAIMYATTG